MNCYECKHRRNLIGDCHSSCSAVPDSVKFQAFSIVQLMGQLKTECTDVQFKAHGVKNGWYNWPLNFDPIWVESCSLYENL